jgi:glutathione peroxidase
MRRKLKIVTVLGLSGLAAVAWAQFPTTPATPPMPAAQAAKTRAWDFRLTAIDGEPLPLSKLSGKVVLLVNTASFCGFTPQYKGLKQLQADYGSRGFTVLGVPSGNFRDQEYKSNKEISTFCQSTFGLNFPLAERSDVVGPNAIPLYRWAAARLGPDNTPRWNFHKYLIGRDGQPIEAFGTRIDPAAPAIRRAIESALKAPVRKG